MNHQRVRGSISLFLILILMPLFSGTYLETYYSPSLFIIYTLYNPCFFLIQISNISDLFGLSI